MARPHLPVPSRPLPCWLSRWRLGLLCAAVGTDALPSGAALWLPGPGPALGSGVAVPCTRPAWRGVWECSFPSWSLGSGLCSCGPRGVAWKHVQDAHSFAGTFSTKRSLFLSLRQVGTKAWTCDPARPRSPRSQLPGSPGPSGLRAFCFCPVQVPAAASGPMGERVGSDRLIPASLLIRPHLFFGSFETVGHVVEHAGSPLKTSRRQLQGLRSPSHPGARRGSRISGCALRPPGLLSVSSHGVARVLGIQVVSDVVTLVPETM